jgi:transcriptional regulator with XRE-family HTH domain
MMTSKQKETSKAFGQALKIYRKRAKLTQEELGERCDLHRTYIGSVERGERNLSLFNIYAVSEALGIMGSEILAETEKIANYGSNS